MHPFRPGFPVSNTKAAARLGIPVCNTPSRLAEPVADLAVAGGAHRARTVLVDVRDRTLEIRTALSIRDVLYINDSKATNIDAAWYALECQTRPVVWIVGGKDKGNDYSILDKVVRERVKAIVCMGVDNAKIHAAFEDIVGKDKMVDTRSAEEAVKAAAAFAAPGDVVLLSPCCASFDLFQNYEDRGRQFKEAVRHL